MSVINLLKNFLKNIFNKKEMKINKEKLLDNANHTMSIPTDENQINTTNIETNSTTLNKTDTEIAFHGLNIDNYNVKEVENSAALDNDTFVVREISKEENFTDTIFIEETNYNNQEEILEKKVSEYVNNDVCINSEEGLFTLIKNSNFGEGIINNCTSCDSNESSINFNSMESKRLNIEKTESELSKEINLVAKEAFDINVIFSENKFNIFRNICNKTSINFISEVTDDVLVEFCYTPMIGSKKINDIKEKLLEFWLKYNDLHKFKYDVFSTNYNFCETEYKMFREFCKENDLIKVNEIKKCDIDDFIKGISSSKKTIENITNRIQEARKRELRADLNISIDSYEQSNNIEINTIFSENKFNMFKKVCSDNWIEYVEEISENTIIEFCALPGAGVAKIKAVKDKLVDFYNQNKVINLKYNIFTVNFVFSEVEFTEFREFCANKQLNYVPHISNEYIEEYKLLKNATKKTYENIEIRINELEICDNYDFEDDNLPKNNREDRKIQLNSYWLEKLRDKKVKEIFKVLFDEEINLELLVSEISNKNLADFKENIALANRIEGYFNSIIDPKSIINQLPGVISDERMLNVLYCRYIENNTLEEIGKKEGITRERVRQIQKKAQDKAISYLIQKRFKESLMLEFLGRGMCGVNEFDELFSNENVMFKGVVLNDDRLGFEVVESLETILFNEDKKLNEKISEIINQLPNIIKISNWLKEIKLNLKSVGIENPNLKVIDNILVSNGYAKFGKYYSKDKITNILALEMIFKDYIFEPIKVNDESVEVIRNLALENINIELGDTTRSIEARIRDCNEILLVERATFIHIDQLEIKNSVLKDIKKYIDIEFKTMDIINAHYLFEKYNELWMKNGINSKYLLYSLIGYYYKEDYLVGKGNSLDIYMDNNFQGISREERVIQILSENNGAITKDKFIETTGWTSIKIDDTISKSERIKRDGIYIVLIKN